MILIISNKGDVHCNPVIKSLSDWNEPFFRLNTEDLISNYVINFNNNTESYSPSLYIQNKNNGKIIDFDQVKSIWERRPLQLDLDRLQIKEPLIADVLLEESKELNWWLRSYIQAKRYIGHYYLDRALENKLLQLKIAASISLNNPDIYIPETILTNNPDKLFKFYRDKNIEFITVKPIGSDSLELDAGLEMPFMSKKVLIKDLEDKRKSIEMCPILTQKYIDKSSELRITVIDKEVFTTEIFSQSLPENFGKEDWREGYLLGTLPQEVIETPKSIRNFCVEYLEKTGLNFGCFDFIHDADGKYAFLECNPNGQWMWMEVELGIPISDSIARYLACK